MRAWVVYLALLLQIATLATAEPVCLHKLISFNMSPFAPTAMADPNDGSDRLFVAMQVRDEYTRVFLCICNVVSTNTPNERMCAQSSNFQSFLFSLPFSLWFHTHTTSLVVRTATSMSTRAPLGRSLARFCACLTCWLTRNSLASITSSFTPMCVHAPTRYCPL